MELNSWQELERILSERDSAELDGLLSRLGPAEVARALSRLSEGDRQELLLLAGPERSAEILEAMQPVQAAGLVHEISASDAAAILSELNTHDQAYVLSEVSDQEAEKILSEMSHVDAEKVRELRSYPEGEVGSLLELDPLAVLDQRTVAEALADLRSNPEQIDGQVFYLYVVDSKKRLRGVVPLRRLLTADPSMRLSGLMVDPITVDEHASLEAVADLFDGCDFLVLPVIDQDSVLLGTIERSEVGRVRAEQNQESWLETQGIIGGQELRSLPYHVRSGRRLSWLSVNVVLNLIAASVIAFYQDTLAQVLALAMFLPIISDMSGCSGNQAVAVSLRELSLGLVRPVDLLYVLRKELIVGVVNGIALGLLLGGVAWFWQGNGYLGLVVGGALAINTVVAVGLGGSVPLVLTRLRLDPALASGPILTTVTDMCGFFLALSFATLMLSRLVSVG